MKRILLPALSMLVLAQSLPAQTAADSAQIKATALDYVEGWYEGNGDRMARALHPDLAKRIVNTDAQGKSKLDHMNAETLTTYTRRGGGKNTPAERQIKNVKILDIFGNVAVVRAEMSDWIDFMHIARFDGRWVIVNVLWEMKK